MKIICPECKREIHGDNINIQADTAMCGECGNVFRISGALPASAAVPAVSLSKTFAPPPPEVLYFEEGDDGALNIFIPKKGLHGAAVGVFVFAALWDAIIIGIIASMIFSKSPGNFPFELFPVLFMIPFVLVGIVIPFFGCWLAWGTTAIRLNTNGFAIVRQLFGFTREKTYNLGDIRKFEQTVAYTQNYQPKFAVRIETNKGGMNFGHKLEGADQEWLAEKLNRSLQTLREG